MIPLKKEIATAAKKFSGPALAGGRAPERGDRISTGEETLWFGPAPGLALEGHLGFKGPDLPGDHPG